MRGGVALVWVCVAAAIVGLVLAVLGLPSWGGCAAEVEVQRMVDPKTGAALECQRRWGPAGWWECRAIGVWVPMAERAR